MKKKLIILLSVLLIASLITSVVVGHTIHQSFSGHFSFSAGGNGYSSSKTKNYEKGYYYILCDDVSFYSVPSYTQLPLMELYLRPRTPVGDYAAGYLTTYYPSTIGTSYWKRYNTNYGGLGESYRLRGNSSIHDSATVYYTWQP